MEDCIFCKIIKGEVPSKKVFENENVLAFQDINPVAPIHILVVPKKHIPTHQDIEKQDGDILVDMHMAINQIAKDFGVDEKGYRVINNCKEDGWQDVHHLHFHILAGKSLGPKIIE